MFLEGMDSQAIIHTNASKLRMGSLGALKCCQDLASQKRLDVIKVTNHNTHTEGTLVKMPSAMPNPILWNGLYPLRLPLISH